MTCCDKFERLVRKWHRQIVHRFDNTHPTRLKQLGLPRLWDAPKALESEYGMREILIAAAIQGAIFSIVQTTINRGGRPCSEVDG